MKQVAQMDGEQVSALADGQLRGEEFARTVTWLVNDEQARLNWHAYHLVGDVLRSGESMVSAHELAFAQRLKLRLGQEMPLRPDSGLTDGFAAIPLAAESDRHAPSGANAANDRGLRWRLLAGFASVVAVGFMGWHLAQDQRDAVQMAQVQRPTGSDRAAVQQILASAATEPAIMVRDPQLDALLAAHRQSGSGSALAMSAGFLRNAAFEGAGR
jgi:sigma-E factor negative regulatory protein RseA